VVFAIITAGPDTIRRSLSDLGHFFASADAASGWAGEHPDGVLLSVPDAFHYTPSLMRHFRNG
jgi:hypothetical protein